MNLDEIIKPAWAEWKRATRVQSSVPQDSAPVLWFGDLEKYQQSNKKIVTIAVNPGPKTFPVANPWVEYPLLNPEEHAQVRETKEHYTMAMNQYRFDDWFYSFTPLFEHCNARYTVEDDNQSQVLHLDISPLITVPTWAYCDA